MAKNIIIKPIISEKADMLSTKSSKYSFVVDKKANKIEIAKAFAEMFPDVTVQAVNTTIMPGKSKSRNTRGGVIRGGTSSYKKAIITLSEGDELDIYGADQ